MSSCRSPLPALVTVALFAFITSWNEFLAALIFMNREFSFTMPILLVSVRTGDHGAVDWGALQASIVISIMPCLAVYLSLQRYYMSGPAVGRGQMNDDRDGLDGSTDRDARVARRSATSRASPAFRSARPPRR